MDSKTVIFFFTLAVLAVAEEPKPIHKDTVGNTKPKRGLAGLDYGFNSFSYPNFAPSSFYTKELSPYFLSENKIPASLNPVFKSSQSDPEATQFHLNQSPIFRSPPLPFQQNYAPLLFNPELQSLGLPQTYQSSENPHTYQPSSIPQNHQPSSIPQNHQLWELSQTYGPSAIPQNYQPSSPQNYQPSSPQNYESSSPQNYESSSPQNYQSLGLPQTYQSLSQQYFKPQVKEEAKPIYEDRPE